MKEIPKRTTIKMYRADLAKVAQIVRKGHARTFIGAIRYALAQVTEK